MKKKQKKEVKEVSFFAKLFKREPPIIGQWLDLSFKISFQIAASKAANRFAKKRIEKSSKRIKLIEEWLSLKEGDSQREQKLKEMLVS